MTYIIYFGTHHCIHNGDEPPKDCHFLNLCTDTFPLLVKYSIYVRLRLDDRHKRKIYPTLVRDVGIQICALEDSQGPRHGFRIVLVFVLHALE